MKKALKITGTTLLVLIVLLITIPYVFQGKIKDLVKQSINKNIHAKVEFGDVSLSFIKGFPQAHLSVSNVVITNYKPFENDTLARAKNIAFSMSVKELFKKSGNPIVVKSIYVDEALVTLKTDTLGNTNYNITKETDKAEANHADNNENSSFSFNIEDYKIKESALTYFDEASKIALHLTQLNHSGRGIFSAETSQLNTKSEANLSLSIDSTTYLSGNTIKLDALIDLDLKKNKYTFKENKAFLNNLPLEFNGYIQLLENEQDLAITFENPESDFKNFLAVIPKTYSKNIETVQTTGNFKVKGIIKGKLSDETIPNLDIHITSNNASFKYPDLPKRVSNISIDTAIKNTTGNALDTYVVINKLDFKIDDDVFKSSATLKNITKNMLVNANLDGVLNLANITKAYPIELEHDLTGILKAKLNTTFDMNAIETNAYTRIKTSGFASITDFVYASKDIVNPIHILGANMTFNPETVSLHTFKAKTGDSDINASGTIKNLLGFLLSNNTLKGDFNLHSNMFKATDFMTANNEQAVTNKTTSDSESLKIPAFLDCTLHANANTVVYDNLNLKKVTGILYIKDQQATLQDMTSHIFDGALSISGNVSTKSETPTFNLNLGATNFDIAKSFNDLELLQNLAPIAKLIQGKLNTTLHLSGELDNTFSPNLHTVSGNALAELLTTQMNAQNDALFNKLEGVLSFIDFNKLNLKDLKTNLTFSNGKVNLKPFNLKYDDIGISVSGSHGFDKTLDYNAVFNVPAKYLGKDVNQLIGKINLEETKTISIPVTANITGSFTNPNVKTDFTSAVKNLTNQLIEIEKQKLLNKGKDQINNALNNILGGNKTKTDSTKKEPNNAIKNTLKDIIGNKKDTSSVKTQTTGDAVKNALGGLLGKKKKTKDSVK